MKKLLLPLTFLTLSALPVRAQVCLPQFIIGCGFGDQINSFFLTGENSTSISNVSSGCGTGNYTDYISTIVDMNAGTVYSADINSMVQSDNVEVFIDFNDDDVFAPNESVGGMNGISDMLAFSTFNITTPGTVPAGQHTMRVIVSGDGTYPGIISCPVFTDMYGGGEVHDYTANFGGTTTCADPTNLAVAGITHDGANLSWTAVVGASGYEYVIDQTAADPTGAGTAITGTSHPATGLLSGTMYYFHLRTDCGGSYSNWVDISFTTLACPAPTGVTESAVTTNSATVSWTPVTGAQGYQYAVTTSMTPPNTGTYTTNASNPVTGLTTMTMYHTWVRTVCGPVDTSAWNAMHMWTTLPVSVANVTGNNFTLQAYPNPAKNMVTVAAIGKGNAEAAIQLTDITGKVINSYQLTAEEMNIDMSRLSTGVYFIRYADDAHRQTLKINKE